MARDKKCCTLSSCWIARWRDKHEAAGRFVMKATDTADYLAENNPGTKFVLWALVTLYAFSRLWQVHRGGAPMAAVVALHIFPPIVFALIHGTMRYRLRGILVFFAISLIVGNAMENIGVSTGFPFGHYYFTAVMGPKIMNVPIMLGLAYLGMGYLSWTLARVILGDVQAPLDGKRVVFVPLVAGFIMLAWDLAMDPIWGTVLRAWVWQRGGAYFGVPISNFVGWYLTVFVIFQLFAIYLRRWPTDASFPRPGYWRLPIIFYAVSAAGNLLFLIPQTVPAVVSDPAGVPWKLSEIIGACAFVSIFIMGGFALLAWTRAGGGRMSAEADLNRARHELQT
jgi:uncharacterized membrane protein